MKDLLKSAKSSLEDLVKEFVFAFSGPGKSKDSFPEFLCIGAQKSGTTWLQECLKQHPQIFLPEEKEVHFFDWKYFRSFKWYKRKFKNAQRRLIGEITPGYSTISKRRINHIARINPDMKIILLLRNPIDRSWSHSKMVLCKNAGKSVDSISEKEWKTHFRSVKSRKRSAYSTIYQDWSSVFGTDRVFVGFYEEIGEDPKSLLQNVLNFLEVDSALNYDSYPLKTKANKGISKSIPEHLRADLGAIYADEIATCCRLFGSSACNWN